MSAYVLAYAMLLITGARLGDMVGYRRLFPIGCGVAPDSIALIAGRVVQGVGATPWPWRSAPSPSRSWAASSSRSISPDRLASGLPHQLADRGAF